MESSGEEEEVDGTEHRQRRLAANKGKVKKAAKAFAADARRADVDTLREVASRMGHKVALVILINSHGGKLPGTAHMIPQLIYMSQTHGCVNFNGYEIQHFLEDKIRRELDHYPSSKPIPSDALYTIVGRHLHEEKGKSLDPTLRILTEHDLDYVLSRNHIGWSNPKDPIADRQFAKADSDPNEEAAAYIRVLFQHDAVVGDRPIGHNFFDEKPTWNLSELLLYFDIPEGMHALVISTACEGFGYNEAGELEDQSPREKSKPYRVSGKLKRKRKTVRVKKLKRFRSKRTIAT